MVLILKRQQEKKKRGFGAAILLDVFSEQLWKMLAWIFIKEPSWLPLFAKACCRL